ncbi:hypothetical protein BABINDRAFT_161799 [Babjeviella inositovora NRRL Y-12698]|uniref:Uncharacterized protein n=1 Tax=Babjeviella inositovora NRRL Y-12698 TaxID=984486 RepID=A0A1E3QNY7_9ASCO|nr:uncharacterized protein BABINDRAFT_161799 [Babjeviella inositovora NRRL Y-12698]ODQ79395.1 hypothetical protein BABINDRAFT_161799 [Babjeviella inositovora NRRL Y-12698]
MFSQVFRQSTRVLVQTRAFSATVSRANLVSELYVKELKAFKPTPLTASHSEGAVKPWSTPVAPKAPAVEGANDVAEYETAAVEVGSAEVKAASAGAAETLEEFFVLEDLPEEEPHH